MQDIDKIEEFLREMKAKMSILNPPIVFRPRDKNLVTLAELEITPLERENFIRKLKLEDCFSGPNKNKDEPSKPDYFEFGLTIKRQEVYIKLSLNLRGRAVDCMSFHIAEKEISYPFKNRS